MCAEKNLYQHITDLETENIKNNKKKYLKIRDFINIMFSMNIKILLDFERITPSQMPSKEDIFKRLQRLSDDVATVVDIEYDFETYEPDELMDFLGKLLDKISYRIVVKRYKGVKQYSIRGVYDD